MKVKIIRSTDNQTIECKIISPSTLTLPSLNEGWRFNFGKHSQKIHFKTFVIVCDDTPDVIEGCLIFEIKAAAEPYMAYIEIAPHNRGLDRRFDNVAGCLIAFACRLSFIHGKGHFQGWLAFDVLEKNKEDEIKLMAVYCKKYGALRWGETTMVISPENGEHLINLYLTKTL